MWPGATRLRLQRRLLPLGTPRGYQWKCVWPGATREFTQEAIVASFPGSRQGAWHEGEGEKKRAWYPLFAHASKNPQNSVD